MCKPQLNVFMLAMMSVAHLATPVVAPAQIPSGTVIAIKTIDAIDSKKATPGQTYRASLDESVMANGSTLAPAGADAVLTLVEAKQAGRLKGNAELTISLTSIKTEGKIIEVNSENITSASTGKGKSSTVKTGIGAAAGGILGGVFGGAKGAAIGTAAGGAAGAGVAMASKGPHVLIPPETRLSFTVQ